VIDVYLRVVARQRCKTPSPYQFTSFTSSTALSIYLGDSVSCLASTFILERYGPRVLAQHVNDGENVMVTFIETWVWMHLDDISLPQVIVSPNYDASSWKIFSRWSGQLLDKSPLFSTDDVFIESHVSYTIIHWLTHNNMRDKITLWFISFFLNIICCTFCRLCRSYCRSLSYIMSFILLFFAVHIVVRCCSYCCFFCRLCRSYAVLLPFLLPFLSFFNRSLFFLSSFNSHSLSSDTDRLDSRT